MLTSLVGADRLRCYSIVGAFCCHVSHTGNFASLRATPLKMRNGACMMQRTIWEKEKYIYCFVVARCRQLQHRPQARTYRQMVDASYCMPSLLKVEAPMRLGAGNGRRHNIMNLRKS